MTITEAVNSFKKYQKKLHAYGHAMAMLRYDSKTCMPKGASANLGVTLSILGEEIYKLRTSQELSDTLEVLKENKAELDAQTQKELEKILKSKERTEKIPMEEFVEYQVLRNAAQQAWHEAKEKSDYEIFKPFLEKIIAFRKKFVKYYEPDTENIYNTMLDGYEEGLTVDILDDYFSKLRADLVPIIHKIGEAPMPQYGFMSLNYPVETQRKLASYLMDILTIDKNHCTIGEVEHPFCTNFGKADVRVTTNYHENSLVSSFYSVIHECGHALYELNMGDDLDYSVLASGTSMGIHESQSRFWENVVGRSEEFCELVFPKLIELFPEQLHGVTPQDFYKAINTVSPSLIRIEADELTYSMHVMVRYEIEKAIFTGDITVDELPSLWNKLYKDYLGVDVPDDAHGILQDVHWSGGMFGYFPSYSLGSAYASQITESLKQDVDLSSAITNNDFKPVVEWLTEHIYKHGCMLTPPEVIMNCCKAEFSPEYYVKYLADKYTKIYNL